MTDIELYNEAYRFLLEKSKISKTELNSYLEVRESKPDNLNTIFKQLCESAQSQQMYPKVIGGSINGISKLGLVFYDFDPHQVAKQYEISDCDKLLRKIIQRLKPKGQIRQSSRSLWPKYCKTMLESAHFLSGYTSARDFYNWADSYLKDYRSKASLPLATSFEISGVGFPLACDFLNELGYSEFGKPDVHLKDIFKAFNLIDKEEKLVSRRDYFTLKVIERIAKENNVSSYAVDKIFWLIGSGKFHLTGQAIGRNKETFIKYMVAKFRII